MNIMLTGASGFVGTNLLKSLAHDSNKIFALGRNFHHKKVENVNYYKIDLLSPEMSELKEKMGNNQIEVIIHAAGQAHIPQTAKNKTKFVLNNVEVTKQILNLARELGAKKFIFLSSVSVLDCDLNDIYAQTKRESEKLVIKFCLEFDIIYTIIRPVLIYGENDEKGNMVKLIKQIRKGIFLIVNKGHNIKNILYIGNLVHMTSLILDSDDWDNRILLARDKFDLSILDICCIIKKELDNKCLFVSISSGLLNAIASSIDISQSIGMFKSINAKSLKRLSKDVVFEVEGANKELVDHLPFTSCEGIARTVHWYK